MGIRKLIAVLVTASLAFWTPSIIPAKAITCGYTQYRTVDTAYAGPGPCPTPSHAPSPWPVFVVFASVGSVLLNAAIVWNTQCRELSGQEAMTSAFLPLVGIALDAHASKCRR